MTKWTAIVVLSVLALLAGVGYFVYTQFGEVATLVYIVFVGASLIAFAGNLTGQAMTLASMRAAINGIVDFQAADDRGEVARANMWRELIRGQNKMAIDDNKHALRNQPQLPAPASEWTWTDVTQQAALPARGSYDDVVIDG